MFAINDQTVAAVVYKTDKEDLPGPSNDNMPDKEGLPVPPNDYRCDKV